MATFMLKFFMVNVTVIIVKWSNIPNKLSYSWDKWIDTLVTNWNNLLGPMLDRFNVHTNGKFV